jgi:DNA-binding transcriptional LysR family regulator
MLEAVEFAEKIRLDPIVTTNSISILKQFVKSGLGIACLPAFSVSTELDAGELFAIPIDHPLLINAEAQLVTRVGRKLSVASNRLLQLMHSQMRAFR